MGQLWLEGLLGFEPRMVELTVTMGYVAYLRGVRAVPRLCYTLAFALQLRKITENLSQGSRDNDSNPASPLFGGAGRRSVSANVCRAVELAGFPHQLTSSRTSQRPDMVREIGDSQVIVNLPVTNVPGCIGNNAKTLGLQYLQFPDMGASGGPPNGARIVHHNRHRRLSFIAPLLYCTH